MGVSDPILVWFLVLVPASLAVTVVLVTSSRRYVERMAALYCDIREECGGKCGEKLAELLVKGNLSHRIEYVIVLATIMLVAGVLPLAIVGRSAVALVTAISTLVIAAVLIVSLSRVTAEARRKVALLTREICGSEPSWDGD